MKWFKDAALACSGSVVAMVLALGVVTMSPRAAQAVWIDCVSWIIDDGVMICDYMLVPNCTAGPNCSVSVLNTCENPDQVCRGPGDPTSCGCKTPLDGRQGCLCKTASRF